MEILGLYSKYQLAMMLVERKAKNMKLILLMVALVITGCSSESIQKHCKEQKQLAYESCVVGLTM